jgi:hypothetical protein
MPSKFQQAFGEGIKAEFKSPFSIDETRARLARLTKWTKDSVDLEGTVTGDSVTLGVVYTFVRSNGTAFRGQIKEKNKEIVLDGTFASSGYQQLDWLARCSELVVTLEP